MGGGNLHRTPAAGVSRSVRSYALALCMAFAIAAVPVQAQVKNITLKASNTPVSTVMQQIEEQSGYTFFYNTKDIPLDRNVTLSVANKDIRAALDELFRNTNVSYSIDNKSIILSARGGAQPQQASQITGRIVDKNGVPVIGATIMISGTTQGTTSGVDGTFALQSNVSPAGMILDVSFIGYKPQRISVNNRTSLSVTLEEDDQQIAPRVGVELVGGVLQRGDSVRVVAYRYDFVTPALVARHREVVGEARQAVLRLGVSVVVVARRDDVGDLAVEPCQCVRGRLPHLAAGLVEHLAVQNDVFVLFDQIARAEHGLDVEVVDVVGDPRRHQAGDGLAGLVLGISLQVGDHHDAPRFGILQRGLPVFLLRRSGQAPQHGGQRREGHYSSFHFSYRLFIGPRIIRLRGGSAGHA